VTLTPYPFGALVRRAFRELDARGTLFDLPLRRVFSGPAGHDFSVRFHGRRVSTPFGPAAGPHTQLAQNIALAWLAGGRVVELKTVQVRDDLVIPRPCIDMQTVGYNVEWSQELRLEQSLEEYVKANVLVRLLAASGRLPVAPDHADVTFDISVGYDYAGLTSERVRGFLDGMRDATPLVDRLRRQVPHDVAHLRDLDVPACIADSVSLSTFHGCPPDEIERMAAWLLRERRLHTVVKLNPTLLGFNDTARLLHDRLGYREVVLERDAFDRDAAWDHVVAFVDRLATLAASEGLGFGVKLTNTLVVGNHRAFFPATERVMYLSGAPLHALAIELLARFRRAFGNRVPVSFSAGIDRHNFPDAVAIGLVPVTACTDLLRTGGYGRVRGYFDELGARMDRTGARDVDTFVLRAYGQARPALDSLGLAGDARDRAVQALAAGADVRAAVGADAFARWRSAAVLRNTEVYADAVAADSRYTRVAQPKPPRKIGRRLWLFDCLTCDKCVPVCPNDANFTFVVPPLEVPLVKLWREGGAWRRRQEGTLTLKERHQIGNFVDFCNDCGNCDVFCPEDGGPYVLKPRFFGSEEAWRRDTLGDGFFVEADGQRARVLGRFSGAEFRVHLEARRVRYSGPGFDVRFDEDDPEATMAGEAAPGVEVDMGRFHVMQWLLRGLHAPGAVNYVNCLTGDPADEP
jgi:putative selenate reductase